MTIKDTYDFMESLQFFFLSNYRQIVKLGGNMLCIIFLYPHCVYSYVLLCQKGRKEYQVNEKEQRFANGEKDDVYHSN